jgi:tetratricopeptide (TPR) repeat protein
MSRTRTATAADTRPIFISYRRDDTSGYAGRLADDLAEMFGDEHVFRDVIKIEPGRDYVEVIDAALDSCSAMVVVIGREWVGSADATGRRRLDNPEDVLRLEVTAALERDTLVIPVLVEDAPMPGPDHLPEPLHGLSRRQAIKLTDTHWDLDLARLATAIESAPGAPSRRRPSSSSKWGGIPRPVLAAAGVVVVLALVVLGAALFTGDGSGPQRMTGSFNIAVADFESLDANGDVVASGAASQLSTRFRRLLELDVRAIDGGQEVQHQGIGRLRGASVDERADAAERVGRDIGADVVVYGVLQSDSGASVLTPEFYLTDRLLFDSSEVVGHHLLGSPIAVPGDAQRTAVQNQLLDQLGARSRILAESIVALGYSSVDNHPAAFDRLTAAEQLPGWLPEQGKEVLYLLLGNAAGKVGRLFDAERSYDRALALSPDYSRASLGKAEVIYHRARGDCVSDEVDVAGLQRSLEIYGNARSGRLPAGAEVPAKAAMGEGRVFVCLSQSLNADRWADAESRLLQVIQAYGGRNVRLRELAAEAHAELGLVYRPSGLDEPGARDKYLRAADEYETAIKLYQETARRRDRQALFYSQLDYLYTRVPDLARADAAHANAIRLAPDPIAAQLYQEAHDKDRARKAS